MRLMLFCFFLGFVLMICYGCSSISTSEYKDNYLEGAWFVSKYGILSIYTKDYKLVIRDGEIEKYKYKIIKGYGILVKDVSTGKLKKDDKGFYLDYTPYWLGFIPMDSIGIVRKISDEEAWLFLKEKV